jgi:hypothetical protein
MSDSVCDRGAPYCPRCCTKTEHVGDEASALASEARQWNCCRVYCPNCRFVADWWDDNGHLFVSGDANAESGPEDAMAQVAQLGATK